MMSAATQPPPRDLLHVFDRLARRIEVTRPIRLLQSALVQVPTVIGWLRPVVLIPLGCLSGLSPTQVEAILVHELSHIRRHDYLVSVLQSIVEALLFYHPAVWWVSRHIRREREHCCDDLAVQYAEDALTYARAL
jgi:beta-lactamase regulating signal transducer with metallopeptidase domain